MDGFYGGIQFGGAWSDEAVNYSPNDFAASTLVNGTVLGNTGELPMPNGYRISQSGLVGGIEAGYNWQWSSWLLGLETDFSFAGMNGTASGTNFLGLLGGPAFQTTTAAQNTDWYGTVSGRAGWLATPNLLLFGTGGFAYGRVDGSANYIATGGGGGFTFGFETAPGLPSFQCTLNVLCFSGSSATIRTGWTAGGGAEWLLDQHWSAKIEYQFVDLGTETVRITALSFCIICGVGPASPSSFSAAFHDRFNVVRLGLNYHF